MKVFISWSGEKSKKLAEELKKWIPGVIQAVKPYYSPDDITKGSRWGSEISQILDESRIGLICLTQENLNAPWIMFEAGALSKNIDKSKVVPILFGVEPTDLEGPLVQFQAARFEKSEIKKIIQMINTELGEAKLSTDILDSVFDMWWPKLDEQIKNIMKKEIDSKSQLRRTEMELLQEILMIVRMQAKRPTNSRLHPDAVKDLTSNYFKLVSEMNELGIYPDLNNTLIQFLKPIKYIARNSSLSEDDWKEVYVGLDQVEVILKEAAPIAENND